MTQLKITDDIDALLDVLPLDIRHAVEKANDKPLPEFQLYETLLFDPADGFFLLDRHLRRLAESARYFGFAVKPECIVKALHERAQDWLRRGAACSPYTLSRWAFHNRRYAG